jgi:hypothetical protein
MSKRVALDRLRDISRPRSIRSMPLGEAHESDITEHRIAVAVVEWPITR